MLVIFKDDDKGRSFLLQPRNVSGGGKEKLDMNLNGSDLNTNEEKLRIQTVLVQKLGYVQGLTVVKTQNKGKPFFQPTLLVCEVLMIDIRKDIESVPTGPNPNK